MKTFLIALILMNGFVVALFAQNFHNNNLTFNSKPCRNKIEKQHNQSPVLMKNGGLNALAVTYSDDFSSPNDTDGLKARGYIPYYRGTGPQGTSASWFQGDTAVWGDYNTDTSNAYVSSDFNSVTLVNDLDNWLVLPALNITAGDQLSFYSRSVFSSSSFDTVRVMYSEVGDTLPEDTTWVELGRFQVNTSGLWLQNVFSAPTSGTSARFAIRHSVVNSGPNGQNGFQIGIDQLDVFTPTAIDVAVLSVIPPGNEYTQIPISQVAGGIALNGTVKNNGTLATTGGNALFEVIDTASASAVFSESVNIPVLNPGVSAVISSSTLFIPLSNHSYTSRITLTLPGDTILNNDVLQSGVTLFTDSVFARDDGNNAGSFGIGAGVSHGIIGQNFAILKKSPVSSVSFYLDSTMNPNPAGSLVWFTLHTQSPGSVPSSWALARTDTLLVMPGTIAAPGQWFTLPLLTQDTFRISPVLDSGLYFVGAHESDSLLTLGKTASIYSPNSVWVSWDSIPTPPAVNYWAQVSDFNYFFTYQVRLNFGAPLPYTGINENSETEDISIYPNPSSGIIYLNLKNQKTGDYTIQVYNSLGQEVYSKKYFSGTGKAIDLNHLPSGVYHAKINSGTTFYNRIIVLSNN